MQWFTFVTVRTNWGLAIPNQVFNWQFKVFSLFEILMGGLARLSSYNFHFVLTVCWGIIHETFARIGSLCQIPLNGVRNEKSAIHNHPQRGHTQKPINSYMHSFRWFSEHIYAHLYVVQWTYQSSAIRDSVPTSTKDMNMLTSLTCLNCYLLGVKVTSICKPAWLNFQVRPHISPLV